MSIYDFKERLEASIDKRMTALAEVVVNGRAQDYAEYRSLAAEIRGLDSAKGMLLDLFQRMTEGRVSNDDESDEGRASG